MIKEYELRSLQLRDLFPAGFPLRRLSRSDQRFILLNSTMHEDYFRAWSNPVIVFQRWPNNRYRTTVNPLFATTAIGNRVCQRPKKFYLQISGSQVTRSINFKNGSFVCDSKNRERLNSLALSVLQSTLPFKMEKLLDGQVGQIAPITDFPLPWPTERREE